MLVDLRLPRYATVHENVAFSTVAMHVTKEYDLVFSVVGRDEFLCEVDGRVEKARWVRPPTIQVAAHHVTAVVADNDSIRVQHWHNLEDERVS